MTKPAHIEGGLFERLGRRIFELGKQITQQYYPYNPHDLADGLQQLIEGKFVEWIPEMYISPETQLLLARQRNRFLRWGFTADDFKKLGPPPTWPDDLDCAVVLDIRLDTLEETMLAAVTSIRVAYENYRQFRIGFDPEHLRLIDGIKHERGLDWRVINIGSCRYDSDRKVAAFDKMQSDLSCPVAWTALWAASYFPRWAGCMGKPDCRYYKSKGKIIPEVLIPGFESRVDKDDDWPSTLWLRKLDDDTLSLEIQHTANPMGLFAIPFFCDDK